MAVGNSKELVVIAIAFLMGATGGLRADQMSDGPRFNLFGGVGTPHPFTGLPQVVGPVIVEVQCKADLGCDPWDFTNCNTGSGLCGVDPTNKWVRVTIAGEVIEGTDSFVGVPNIGDPPVPNDGHFFGCFNGNSTSTPECGYSLCTGAQFPNLHRFTITESQWNTWLGSGSTISINLTSQSGMKNMPVYCTQDASGTNCCPSPTSGECGTRPGSNATVIITYTPAPIGSCCIPSTGECQTKTESQCDALGGDWTQGGVCVPNQCAQPAMGACCFGSGVCYLRRSVDCSAQGGSFFGDGTTCEPNPCNQPPIIYVDRDATGMNDGSSWADACTTLQSALALAAANSGGEQIWVAEGTYKPSVPTGRDATFQLLNDVAIYGGFAGDESTVDDRDITANPTILSGDLDSNDGPNFSNYTNNAYHVVTGSLATAQAGRSAVLDGFTVTGGNANGTGLASIAGGLLIVQGGPTIRNCIFVSNSSLDGGGAVYVSQGTPTLINCVFNHNRCTSSTSTGGGLRVVNGQNGACTVTNCTFVSNSVGGNPSSSGGGMASDQGSIPNTVVSVSNTTFWSNTAASGTASQIFNGSGVVASFSYCNVQGGFSGTGNINSNPLFVDADGDDNTVGTADDNLRLMTTSPCIDAANNLADIDAGTPGIQPLLSHDADLHARRMDDPDKADTGVVSCPIVDMGAYEFRRICEATSDCVTRGDSDTDTDGVVDGLDIQPFAECLTQADPECTGECQCFDMDLDGFVTMEGDLPCFIAVLLDQPECVVECSAPTFRSGIDCNENGLPDSYDLIVALTSEDCNANGIPDECEIDENSTAEGGPWYCESDCATDVNDNGIPDECEDDCNTNGIPDAWDISEETSDDVNTNGIPDECEKDCNTNGIPDAWDISETTSADCNADGTPDECEDDCNTNGVPDDCDVDPTDPDGDEWVSPDCNENGYPDECDMSLPPPFGSGDCNTNGIPDECDIADCESDPACDDCNENGIPDGCDIDAEISEDTDTNGIPDECEGESLMGGGGGESMMSSGEGGESDWSEEAAWESFYEWSITQCWGLDCEAGMDEQFESMIDKLRELGLPEERP